MEVLAGASGEDQAGWLGSRTKRSATPPRGRVKDVPDHASHLWGAGPRRRLTSCVAETDVAQREALERLRDAVACLCQDLRRVRAATAQLVEAEQARPLSREEARQAEALLAESEWLGRELWRLWQVFGALRGLDAMAAGAGSGAGPARAPPPPGPPVRGSASGAILSP